LEIEHLQVVRSRLRARPLICALKAQQACEVHRRARGTTRPMTLHFQRSEFDARLASARAALQREKLDAILLFAQESLYYLTGFDTSGFVFFQCALLTADAGEIVLLTR